MYLAHIQHYKYEVLGSHYMQLFQFEVKCTKILCYKNNFYNSGIWMSYSIIFKQKEKKNVKKVAFLGIVAGTGWQILIPGESG